MAADAMPADIYIFTDGGLQDVPNFDWGNLEPKYVKFGIDAPKNLGITALGVNRNFSNPDRMQAFVRVENFGPDDVSDVQLSLYLDDTFLDATAVNISSGGVGGTQFEFDTVEQASLRVEVDYPDQLVIDNVAHAGINPPLRAEVLVITPGNDAMIAALSTSDMATRANIDFQSVAYLQDAQYEKDAENNRYDLIIFDQCSPPAMPQCNTFFIGRLPPGNDWSATEETDWPNIIDSDNTHPLMKYLNFGNVQLIAAGRAVSGPPGQKVLIQGDVGALCTIAPRDGFEDIVLGFEIVGADDEGQGRTKNRLAQTIELSAILSQPAGLFRRSKRRKHLGELSPGASRASAIIIGSN